MSKALMKQFSDFEPGEICYEMFRGREKPCRNCPLAHPNRKTDLFYNEDQGKWLKINAGEVVVYVAEITRAGPENDRTVSGEEVCTPTFHH